MMTYIQYFNESYEKATKHTVEDDSIIANNVLVRPGDIYYLDTFGFLHREDGPAIIWKDGGTDWYMHGERHREGGKPAKEYPDGTKMWYENDKRHREDGPAVVLVRNGGEIVKNWYYLGSFVDKTITIPFHMQKAMILDDVNNIKLIKDPIKEVQGYVIQKRPDLIGEIDNLDQTLKEKYSDELKLAGIDI